MELVRRKVRGTFLSTDGKPLRGSVMFLPSDQLTDSVGNVVLLKRPIKVVAVAGVVEADLPVTDDARFVPASWHYRVTEDFEGGSSRPSYSLSVPEGSGIVPVASSVADTIPPKPSEVPSWI